MSLQFVTEIFKIINSILQNAMQRKKTILIEKQRLIRLREVKVGFRVKHV